MLNYETGNVTSKSFSELDELLKADLKNIKKEILQALIYTRILWKEESETDYQLSINSLRNILEEKFSPNMIRSKHDFSFSGLKKIFKLG